MKIPTFSDCPQLYVFIIMVLISNIITLYMKWTTFDPIQNKFSTMMKKSGQDSQLEMIKRDMYVKSVVFYIVASGILYILCRKSYSKIAWTIVGVYIAVVLIEVWFYHMLSKIAKLMPTQELGMFGKSEKN